MVTSIKGGHHDEQSLGTRGLDGAQGAGTGRPSVCAAFKTGPEGKVPIEEDLHEQERGRLT